MPEGIREAKIQQFPFLERDNMAEHQVRSTFFVELVACSEVQIVGYLAFDGETYPKR
jgi:hypothetical protein